MKKFILTITILSSLLFANNCADEFSPDKFVDSSDFLEDLIETNFQEVALFGTAKEYEKLGFEQKEDYFYKSDSYTTYRAYTYPKVMGLWNYKLNQQGKVDEVNIAQLESGREETLVLADMITSDFEGPWIKWDGDAYEHYMVPEFTRIKYKEQYLSLKVIFWGVKDDSARVERSTINYQLIDFTDEVNGYMKCMNLN
jgi:hypothetical protein